MIYGLSIIISGKVRQKGERQEKSEIEDMYERGWQCKGRRLRDKLFQVIKYSPPLGRLPENYYSGGGIAWAMSWKRERIEQRSDGNTLVIKEVKSWFSLPASPCLSAPCLCKDEGLLSGNAGQYGLVISTFLIASSYLSSHNYLHPKPSPSGNQLRFSFQYCLSSQLES